MSGRRDWNRPIYRTRGRIAESISGGDLPAALRSTPRQPQQSKAEQRDETERLVAEFMAKKKPDESKGRAESAPAPSGKPPWDD